MMLKFIDPILSRLALWWLTDLMLAHRTAAIVNLNTLKAGEDGLLLHSDARSTVKNSLKCQIVAIEALMGLSEDD